MSVATSVHVGEIHVPGAARLHGARTFILTKPAVPGNSKVELLFGVLAGETQKKIIDKLADRLVEELRPVFFNGEGDAEARYEAALKQANRAILVFLHEHGLSLPGIALRGAIGAIAGDRLLVSSRGALKGTLVVPRDKRFAAFDLFDDGGDRQPSPKFFASLQSGILRPGARLFIATNELFQTLDEAFVARLFTDPDAARASRELKNALRSSPQPVTLLTVSTPMPPEDDLPAAVPAGRTAPAKRRQASRSLAPALAPSGAGPVVVADPGDLASRGIRAVFSGLWSGLKLAPAAVGGLLRALAKLPLAVAALFRADTRRELSRKIISAPDRLVSRSIDRLNAVPAHGRLPFLVLFVAANLFFHGVVLTVRHQLLIADAKAYEGRLTEFQRLQTDLEASMIYGNDERSRALFAQMKAVAAALPNRSATEARAKQSVDQTVTDAENKLRKLVVIEKPDLFASIADAGRFKGGAFAWFKGGLYLFSPSEPTVAAVGSDGTVGAPLKLGGLATGIAAAAPAASGFILIGQDGKAAYWNPSGSTAVAYADVVFEPKNLILFYQARLYAVEADGSVTRRAVLSRKFGPAITSVQAADGLKNASGLASDAALYLLSPAGEIRKYLRGQPAPSFSQPKIDPPPAADAGLWTDPQSPWLMFIERGKNRLFIIDKNNGRLGGQLTSPAFASIDAFAVDDQSNFAYLLSDGKIFKVPLPKAAP